MTEAPFPSPVIQADFDRLAPFDTEAWSHNSHYHAYLLRHVPPRCEASLDIGCGTGAFTRLLARRSAHVLGLDLSPEMIEVARSRSAGYSNVTYEVADVLAQPLPAARYDCIASIATLHHLPLARMLAEMGNALRPGGVLLVLDLFEPEDWRDRLLDLPGVPASLALRLLKRGSLRESAAARQAWAIHGQHDTYPTLKAVRQACEAVLPGAAVRRHVLWRYSIIWRKPLQEG